MKKKVMMAGGYILAGMLSCSVLVAAAKCANDDAPEPVKASARNSVAVTSPTGDGVSSAKADDDPATAPQATVKRRRTRKASAKKDGEAAATRSRRAAAGKGDDATEAPRKPRARRGRKPAADGNVNE